MSDKTFTVKINMLSDFQIGTGAGIPGSTDELISKDADGFPQVPAKTIVGIWRDALERLTFGLDNGGKSADWQKWVEVIFGSQPNVEKNPGKTPVSAIVSTQPARIPKNLRANIGYDRRLKQALTFTKVGVRIDPESGTSETDMLRFEEMGRIGTVLETNIEANWKDFSKEQVKIALGLLILSSGLVQRLGGKRRRGAGRCSFELYSDNNSLLVPLAAKTIIEDAKNKEISPPGSGQRYKRQESKIKTQSNGDHEWKTCEYTLTLETPVSIVSAVLGNVSETLDFVPGTYLISHFVKRLGQDVFKAIQNGDFQISPATISIDGKRSLPVPKVFAQEKMDKTKVYNRLLETLEGKKQTKPIREGFFVEKDDKILHAEIPQTILMHNAVDDNSQRPTSDVVGVYSREAIRAGTILKGEIRYRGLEIEPEKLNGKVRIGTSKKDDYGLAKIEFATKTFEVKSVGNTNQIAVYLASDVMLRNGNLRQTNLAEDLAEAIGLDRNSAVSFQNIHVRRIESWQVGWGLPRPTMTLMQAGSVVVFEANLNEIRTKQIEAEGIGERRGEGYGRLIFNPQFLETKSPAWKNTKADKYEIKDSEDEIVDKEFARFIEETAWREEIKIAVSKIAAEDVKKKASEQVFGFKGLNMSQIGGLRSVIMRLRSIADEDLVENWLEHLEKTSNRRDKWKEWRIEKVREILKDDKIWKTLEKNGDFTKPKSLGFGQDLKKELWAEAVKSLFYACQMAHKRETEKPKTKEAANGKKN